MIQISGASQASLLQLSVAVASPVLAGLLSSSQLMVTLAGQLMAGEAIDAFNAARCPWQNALANAGLEDWARSMASDAVLVGKVIGQRFDPWVGPGD